ncbi:MAG: response regulator transcription factor [Lunatimonas sp.]|uniref:LytR/AlgR family response regulator transcription factor n=1 Tax=Lunatimonas sp. TaxID=2060141 RepID=UPI00263B5B34|nr:LytTR family DNA-binding domain-containing protein [Lunatimonas sp.]MCC5939083.1 response regulator transcription factor [Lunatimonas sp.]
MLSAVAIDDEYMALEVIKSHASKVPFLHLTEVFTDAIKALEYVKEEPVDLVFLDIKMPDISGMEVAALLPKRTLVIFTTAYSEHAVKGFELDATDYLLKPFSLARFLQACQRAREWHDLKHAPEQAFLFVKTGSDQVKIRFEDLLYCEAQGNYVTFHLLQEKVVGRTTLAEIEKQLPATFVKTHRSFIANLTQVRRVERHQLTVADKVVPISSTFQDLLAAELNKWNPAG